MISGEILTARRDMKLSQRAEREYVTILYIISMGRVSVAVEFMTISRKSIMNFPVNLMSIFDLERGALSLPSVCGGGVVCGTLSPI